MFCECEAWEFSSGVLTPITIQLSMEYTLTISINGSPYLTVACSGSDLRELAVGHMLSEGIIQSIDDINGIEIDFENLVVNVRTNENEELIERLLRIRSVPSGCGIEAAAIITKTSDLRDFKIQINASEIISIMKKFLNYSEHHKMTRGVHSAALYTATGKRLSFFDEIGRHNAVDKIIGDALLRNIALSDKIITTTGRISGEITAKAQNSGVLALISRSRPTSISIDMAKQHGLILIGAVRSSSFVVFNGKESLKI